MTLLAQQELLPPEPRKTIVSEARAWWGVDPGTKRVAIGSVTEDGERSVVMREIPKNLMGAARLREIHQIVEDMLLRALHFDESLPHPGYILVEQPSGKHVNHSLQFAVGVVIAAIAEVLPNVEVGLIDPQSWKKSACGRGNLYKPGPKMRAAGAKYEVLVWANENGYDGSSWDEADALGIAEAARRRVALTTAP
jgi:Holliday junction resolvasome RuvABC endonuclease subunit